VAPRTGGQGPEFLDTLAALLGGHVSEYDESGGGGGGRAGGCLLQVVTHGVVLVLGAILGVLGSKAAEYVANPELRERPEGSLSRAELIAKLDEAEKRYADMLAENARKEEIQKSEFDQATAKVSDLEGQVSKKQDEVKLLELKVKKGKQKSAALTKELEERTAELAALQVQLDEARAQVVQLQADLDVSHEETRTARLETDEARSETVDARWEGFVSDALVQVCEKGNRNKLAKCRDEVTASLDSKRQARFKQCVSGRQASPRMVRVDDKEKDPQLPRWSEWVNEESKFTEQKWYITFCDPTLPEARSTSTEDDPF
jgi:predicted  nucleic acid-binding Zn-ribbon protein